MLTYTAHTYLNSAMHTYKEQTMPNSLNVDRKRLALSQRTPMLWAQACQAHHRGDLTTAFRLYCRLVTREPQHVEALYRLGCIAFQQGQPAQARDYLMQALALRPDDAAIHNGLGEVARALGDLQGATTHYQQALELDPQTDSTSISLGEVLPVTG